jgi:putative ABC transport system ATP-binding protein
MLILRRLSKTFAGSRDGKPIFEDLNFELKRGEYVALMGESGAGKSTLLNIVAGLEPASSGELVLDGSVLNADDDDRITLFRREKLGFIFQAFHLLPYLNALENVALPLRLNGGVEADVRQRAEEMLACVGLTARQSAMPRELSGGEMQRVAIARALAHKPALLLADEPTGNLDPDTAAQVLAVLRAEISRLGTTAILVTHSELAAASADRVVALTRSGIHPRMLKTTNAAATP